MPYSRKIVYLTEEQRNTLVAEGSITVGGVTVIYNENDIYLTPQDEPLTDVQVNGTSVVADGVANVPISDLSTLGVVKSGAYGIENVSGELRIHRPSDAEVKTGGSPWRVLNPAQQHQSVFYGLAKAAGDQTQSASSNPVGTYTSEAKAAIQHMFGTDTIVGSDTPTTSTAAGYIGQLYFCTDKTTNYGSRYGFYICMDITNGEYTWRRLFTSNDSIGAINFLGKNTVGEANVITIGQNAGRSSGYATWAISIGAHSEAYTYGLALGHFAKALAAGSGGHHTIQLGDGTNSTAGTFQVNTYRMLEANGIIPPERITTDTWTETQKAGVRNAIGVESGISLVETVSGTTPTITGQPNVRYMCGEVSTIDITPPANGTIDVIFTSGSTAAVLTVPSTVKFPAWFDSTSLDTDTMYEIMITDGIFGAVMSWAN